MRPYIELLRLDKPIGIWLVFFPAAWAVMLASPTLNLPLLLVMLVGAVVMRAAGCIINDLADRRLDAQVERTKNRPLASGAVPANHAYILLAALLCAALLLALGLPAGVLLPALLALPLVAAYPWMKRLTWWPQMFLGITFNFGVPIGWAATGMPFTPATLALYAACLFWTLGYDTIYAIQDIGGDRGAGIKSSALRLGGRVKEFVALCYALMLLFLLLAGWAADSGMFYLAGLVAATAHAWWQVRRIDASDAAGAKRLFLSNQWLGAAFFAALLLEQI